VGSTVPTFFRRVGFLTQVFFYPGDEGDHVQVADDDQGEGRQPHGGDRGDSLQGQQVRHLLLVQEELSKFNESGSVESIFFSVSRIRRCGTYI
jgi:hypothetical protein